MYSVDTLQCILLALGIVVLGAMALSCVGGFEKLNEGIAALSQLDTRRTPDDYSHYIAIPGVIQFVSAGPKATGGAWTGIMILTCMFALMGIHSSPALLDVGFLESRSGAFRTTTGGVTLKLIHHAARLQGNGTTLSGIVTSRR